MKLDNIKLNSNAIGEAIYLGQEGQPPRQVNGQRGSYVRHLLMNERHGLFYVITPVIDGVIEEDARVNLDGCEPKFFEDYAEGRQVAPYVSVFAKKINVVK